MPWALVAAVGSSAFVVRLAYVLSIQGSPFLRNLQTNAARYDAWALLILTGHPPPPPYDQAPGYAYLLAGIYRLFDHSILAAQIFQSGLDAAAVAGIVLLTRRLSSHRAAILAGTLAVLHGPLIYFSGELVPATVTFSALTGAATAAAFGRWRITGILCALAVLFWTESALALLPLAWMAQRRHGVRTLLETISPSVIVYGTVWILGMWQAHAWVPLNTGAGLNLWLGNNPYADGVSPFVAGPLRATEERIREAAQRNSIVVDRLFAAQAAGFWREYPAQAAALLYKKLRWTFSAQELPSTADLNWQLSYSWLFKIPGLPIGFGFLLVCSAAGLAYGKGLGKERAVLLAPTAIGLVDCLLFFTNGRMRLPLAIPLLALAGHGIDRLWWAYNRRRRARKDLYRMAAAMAVAAMLAWTNPYKIKTYRVAHFEANAGIAEYEATHYAEAIRHLRVAVEMEPGGSTAWIYLALSFERQQAPAAAAEAFLNGLEHNADPEGDLREMALRFFRRHKLPATDLETYLQSASPDLRAALRQQILSELHD